MTGWVIACSASYSAGGTWPSSPCSRRLLYQSMYSTVAISRSSMPAPRALVADEFGLEQRVERLGHRVVVGVARGADRGDGAGLGEPLGVADRLDIGRPCPSGGSVRQVGARRVAAPDAPSSARRGPGRCRDSATPASRRSGGSTRRGRTRRTPSPRRCARRSGRRPTAGSGAAAVKSRLTRSPGAAGLGARAGSCAATCRAAARAARTRASAARRIRTVLQRTPPTPGHRERPTAVPVTHTDRRPGQDGPLRHPKTRSPQRHPP